MNSVHSPDGAARGGGGGSGGGGQPNLTPMIDVVFQLIIFFLLVAQFSRQQTIDLTLPKIAFRQSEQIHADSRAVVNVAPAAQILELGGSYRVGSLAFAETESGVRELAEVLRGMKARQPDLKVFIRADRLESYARVHPAMQAVTLAGIDRMELVTTPPDIAGPDDSGR